MAEQSARDARPPARVRPRRALRELPLWVSVAANLLVALVLVSLVQAFLVRVHNVSSGSMLETLGVSDRVLSSQVPYWGSAPQRGDIVIFGHGETWDDERRAPETQPLAYAVRLFGDLTGIGLSNRIYTVKRVIGTPGDQVACCDAQGRVLVNGQGLDEPYLEYRDAFEPGSIDCSTSPRSRRCFAAVTVPEGRYLVMGDNRSNSADSVEGCRVQDAPADCARFVLAGRITGKVIAKAWPPGPVR